ncbi:MAG: GDSL-type esterase/lipase family protein [Pirellulaceae bacterium]|jgi:lysophospholipase L1-like esterase|nr:GDSL-type esterase/lipase family protein [Pirellulaceae bacterium]
MLTDQATHSSIKKEHFSALTTFKRIGYATWLTSVGVLALLTFPSAVPWMIAGWLVWHSLSAHRNQVGWAPLIACVCVLMVKRIYLTPWLFGFVAVALVVALLRAVIEKRKTAFKRFMWVGTLGLWIVWVCVVAEFRFATSCNHPVVLDPSRPVVCVGDSITSGLVGEVSYPEKLERLIRLPVINVGQNGITTEMAYDLRLRIVEANPQVVIIELGGHDFLKGRTRAETKHNLERLIATCRQLGAQVVLFEIPRGFMTDPFAGLERDIAYQHDLELIGDSAIRNLVLWSPISPPGMWLPSTHLSEDGIHPNVRGTTYLAKRVADGLVRIYGEELRFE